MSERRPDPWTEWEQNMAWLLKLFVLTVAVAAISLLVLAKYYPVVAPAAGGC